MREKSLRILITVGLFISLILLGTTISSASYSANNPKVKSGDTITITVTSSVGLDAYNLDLQSYNGLTYKSCSKSENGAIININGSSIGYMNASGTTKTLGTYTFTAPNVTQTKTYSVKFLVDKGTTVTSTVTVEPKEVATPPPATPPPSPSPTNNGNEDPDKELPQEQVPTTNTTASSNNQLSSLKVDVGTLSPKFNSWTKEYTVDVAEEVENIKITANKSHSKATVAGTGTKKLNPGANVFKIDVTAENGSVNTYTITVNKPKPPEKEAELKLKSLTIKGVNTSREMVDLTYTPEFSEEVYSYEMEVEHDIESLSIEALAKEEGTIVEITGNENLVVGENIVTIIIKTANEEKSATYQIIVKKAEQLIAEAVVAEPETIPHDTIQSDYWMIMIIVAGVVAIVVGSIIIIILHKRQDRETEAFEIDSMGVFEEQKKSKKSKKAKEQNNIDDTKGKGRGRHF